jgi:ABC-type glycerol-3-phosphate transport system permease component
MAASLVILLPLLVTYYFAQRYLIGGIAAFGLKG